MRKRDFISKLNSLDIFDSICEKNLTSTISDDVKSSYVVWAHFSTILDIPQKADEGNIICIFPNHTNPIKWFNSKTIHHFLKMHHFDRMDIFEVHIFLSNFPRNKTPQDDISYWINYYDFSKKEKESTLSDFMQLLEVQAHLQ